MGDRYESKAAPSMLPSAPMPIVLSWLVIVVALLIIPDHISDIATGSPGYLTSWLDAGSAWQRTEHVVSLIVWTLMTLGAVKSLLRHRRGRSTLPAAMEHSDTHE
ncbi:hypothetical protein AB0O34_29035 [Sphaerisporangium sp. NPDC088356]|uniref:hypothetical protein n=1 Tax=Sphaerisporangium sp. NPDC088356 TaxID=3154871 RepID=UPI0034409D46